MSTQPVHDLLADVGGTNARFALSDGSGYGSVRRYTVADFDRPSAAIRAFLRDAGAADSPRRAVLAFAGPVADASASLTNGGWATTDKALQDELGLDRVVLLNDFEAVAWALPGFAAADLRPIGGGKAKRGAPMAVLGPGTGLGVAAFIPDRRSGSVLATEGGHATLAAADAREADLIAALRDKFGHVSAERILSGSGLEALFQAVVRVDGLSAPPRKAPEITALALSGECAASEATLRTFCAMLGGFAGNLALTLGAAGGVYLAGGILPRLGDYLATSEFRTRFEAKGRFSNWLAGVPTHLIARPDPAFPGLVAALAASD